MVHIVAMIFLMINGAPSEKPVRSFTYNQTFENVEACMAFSKTEDGLMLSHHLNEYVMSQRGTIMARIGCVEAEDNSI
ncbi:hypothetical protein [Bradyrhizobium sp. SZCCHNRI1073]|uniref:hypothetical protein n=1 Tax=Bradyrhizobium sp. SZCCHNRI1073 TaxID=3057280 RepID=UPI002916CAAE|nr:hypothetical protein [Bradyrhizobium sp. SZCCHNRI1073]